MPSGFFMRCSNAAMGDKPFQFSLGALFAAVSGFSVALVFAKMLARRGAEETAISIFMASAALLVILLGFLRRRQRI
jgi:hypothetical protein